jgi:hypothetical protein
MIHGFFLLSGGVQLKQSQRKLVIPTAVSERAQSSARE